MRKLIILFLLVISVSVPVNAMEFTAPTAPEDVQQIMPDESKSFSEDLWYIIKNALGKSELDFKDAINACISLIAVMMLVSMMQTFNGPAKRTVDLACVFTISVILMKPANALIQLGTQTIQEISEYGKLLIPVMTAALAAEGGVTASAALYTATIAFNTVLTTGITKLIIPMIYIYIVLCIATSAIGENVLKQFRDLVKWLMTWTLKISIYLFTGYLGLTGVITGTTDAAAIKATKLAINGFVPVIGNIISDASETILVSAGIMKNSVGLYGLLVILATWISPFLKIGAQYILLKLTTCVCGVFGTKESVSLVEDFSGVMGFILATTGTVCLLLLISIVCFMKGVA